MMNACVVLTFLIGAATAAPYTFNKQELLEKARLQGNCGNVQTVSRAEWGARPPTSITYQDWADEVFIHHTVTAECHSQDECSATMRSMQDFHMDSNGWSDIGYNMVVGNDGRLYEGRGYDVHGAHAGVHNTNSIGISVVGNFMEVEPSELVLQSIYDCIDCAQQEGILTNSYELFGHRDGGCTACPGDQLYAIITTWPEWSDRDLEGGC